MLASFFSFPIWTRLFNRTQYGLFALINVGIAVGVAFSKFGLQHAALRFYSEFKYGQKDNSKLDMYYSTLFLSSCIICFAVSAIFIPLNFVLLRIEDVGFLILISTIIFISGINRILLMFLRAANRGLFWGAVSVWNRYGALVASLVFVISQGNNLKGYFYGVATASAITLAVLYHNFANNIKIKHFSLSFFHKSIKYGFPLIWMELSNLFLNVGDRYILNFFRGTEIVGLYSAGYNMANMSYSFIGVPFKQAAVPVYLNLWSKKGEKGVVTFLEKIFEYYCILSVIIISIFLVYSKEIIELFASKKYSESYIFIPYIIIGLSIYGANTIFSAGLQIYKKTKVLMLSSILSALLNFFLNIPLIHFWGAKGAALSTLLSYSFLSILVFIQSKQYIKMKFRYRKPIIIFVISFLLIFLTKIFFYELFLYV